MVYKHKLNFLCLIFVIFFTPALLADEIRVPLPEDARLVSEKEPFLGSFKTASKTYKTLLKKDKIEAFYRQELKREGWNQDEEGAFIKGDNILRLAVSAWNQDGNTRFTILTSRIPETEEVNAVKKENPDKLKFMPIYPGSKQIYFWDLANGATGRYETLDSIKEVVFFYKSAMLNYGWSLVNDKALDSDCPSCKKPVGSISSVGHSQIILTFTRQPSESCSITISDIPENHVLQSNKTIISIAYHVYKAHR